MEQLTLQKLRKRAYVRKVSSLGVELWDNRYLYLFVIPGVIWFLIFNYQPMYGILIAFKDYDIASGVFASQWVGFKYFADFFNDANFKNIMINTLSISMLKIIFGFPAPIILALLMNEVRNATFKRITQTVSYLPFFVSWVVVYGIWYDFLSVDDGGLINSFMLNLGLIKDPVFWFGEPKYFWGIVVVSDVWKNVGFGTIIYLAALSGINPEIYESAAIDGAGKFRQIWHITLPGLRPTILMLFILGMGNILNAGFDQIYVMQNPAVAERSEIIDTYVATRGIFQANYELATAIGLFKSVVGIMMLFMTNFAIKLTGEEGII